MGTGFEVRRVQKEKKFKRKKNEKTRFLEFFFF